MAAAVLPERMNLPPLAPMAAALLRTSLLRLLEQIEAIPEAHRADEKSITILFVLREFERALALHPNPEEMHNLYLPRLHIVLRDPKFLFAPLENARLGSDGFTYEQRCLDLYRMLVPPVYQDRSPMRPNDPAPFNTVAHPVVPLILHWMDQRRLPRVNPELVEAMYLQVLRRVQEAAPPAAAAAAAPILPELVAQQAALDQQLAHFEDADARAFEEEMKEGHEMFALEMDYVAAEDPRFLIDGEAQLAAMREVRRAIERQFEANAGEARAMQGALQQDLDRVEHERIRAAQRDRQRMEGLERLQAEEAAAQAQLFAAHQAELQAAAAAGIGPLEHQVADLIDRGIADRAREVEAMHALQEGVAAVGNQQRAVAANAQAIVAGQLALIDKVAAVNIAHADVREGIRRTDAYIQAKIDEAAENDDMTLRVIGTVVLAVGAILTAPIGLPAVSFALGAGALYCGAPIIDAMDDKQR